MRTIKLNIGQYMRARDGQEYDNCRPVQFVGVQLAKIDYGTDRGRGTTETLYKTAGRLVVHIENWSSWVGEPTTYELHEVSEEMLGPGGPYEFLGRAAGYGRPLTLDEALA